MSDYLVTKRKGPYPTDMTELKVGPNEETIEIYGEDAEKYICSAFKAEAKTCIKVGNELAKALLEIDSLRAENEKLRAERDECERQLQSSFNKMGEILEERNVLRAALKPFADEGAGLTDEHDDLPYDYGFGDCVCFTNGHLRAAAAALKETGE